MEPKQNLNLNTDFLTVNRETYISQIDKEIEQKKRELALLQQEIEQTKLKAQTQHTFYQNRNNEVDHAYTIITLLHRQLDLIANQSPLAISYTDKFNTYSYSNDLFQKWTGKELVDILGWNIDLIWSPDMAILINELQKKAIQNKIMLKTHITFPDGNKRFVILTVVPEYNEHQQLIGFFHFMEDVTHFKKTELTLTHQNEQLTQEIEKRTLAENELKKSNGQLKHFAYAIAHDLKSPILSINGFSKILLKRHKKNLAQDAQEMLDYVVNASSNMGQMVNDLLKYATLDKEHKRSNIIDLNDSLLVAKHHLKLQIEETKAKLITNNLPKFQGHQTLFVQLFQNIISNALKFHKKGTLPIINVNGQEEGNQIYITISDNGIGIRKIYLESIFGVFQRLNNTNEYSGSGIGLATCKKNR